MTTRTTTRQKKEEALEEAKLNLKIAKNRVRYHTKILAEAQKEVCNEELTIYRLEVEA